MATPKRQQMKLVTEQNGEKRTRQQSKTATNYSGNRLRQSKYVDLTILKQLTNITYRPMWKLEVGLVLII
jgi:hypothetical protein